MRGAIWVRIFAVVVGAAAGCAFQFSDPSPPPNACSTDRDCVTSVESCSLVSHSCVLLTPPSKNEHISGTFHCDFSKARVDGSGLTVAWPSFDDFRGTWPPADAVLGAGCFAVSAPSGDTAAVELVFNGARQYDASFMGYGFYRALFLFSALKASTTGVQEVTLDIGRIGFCPADPPSASWRQLAKPFDGCLVPLGFDQGQIALQKADLSEKGVIIGSLDFPLKRFAAPPDAGVDDGGDQDAQ